MHAFVLYSPPWARSRPNVRSARSASATRKAAEHYLNATAGGEMTPEAFINAFNDDIPVLTANGVNPDDIPIVLDYVLMNPGKAS